MQFASDNRVGAHKAILSAIADANEGTATSYGYDEWTRRAEEDLARVFECELDAFLVLTGTAANALALSSCCPPYGAVLCHEEAHINTDECGAPEMFSGGARLAGLWGPEGKITPELIKGMVDGLIRGEHESKPSVVSITQATELGTVYRPDEMRRLSEVCRDRGLKLHMDGSRFANAVASLNCPPAELSWRAGVDVMSFGGTKNGALMLEAVIFFDRTLADNFRYRRKRGGQLLSKGRFLGAQMCAYLSGELWLENARHANRMAKRLAEVLARSKAIRLPLPTEANEVFAILPRRLHEALLNEGVHHYEWPGKGAGPGSLDQGQCLVRFVTSFMTTESEINGLASLIDDLTK